MKMQAEVVSSEEVGPVRDLALHGIVRGQRRLGREIRAGIESHGRSMKGGMIGGMIILAVGLVLTPVSAALASWLEKSDR